MRWYGWLTLGMAIGTLGLLTCAGLAYYLDHYWQPPEPCLSCPDPTTCVKHISSYVGEEPRD